MANATEAVVPRGVPIPDPTVLTTQQLVRELKSLREILEAQIAGQRSVFESRIDGMDKAIQLLQVATDKQPEVVDGKIGSLRILHEEKFRSIQTQFTERDVRTEQSAKDSKVAVDAALQAAKEAVGEQNKSSSLAIAKSETATTKQIDQQATLITSMTKTMDDKIDDIKQRLITIEGRANGVTDAHDNSRANMALIVSIVIGAVVLVEGLMAVFRALAPISMMK